MAVALCYLARSAGPRVGGTGWAISAGHPRPCEFCDFPVEVLAAYAKAYREWAMDADGQPTDPDLRRFASLPRREQTHLRYLAQYGEEPMGVDGSVQARMGGHA